MKFRIIRMIDNEIKNIEIEISDNDEFFDSKIFKEFRIRLERIIHESYNEFDDDFDFDILDKIYILERFYINMRYENIINDIESEIIFHYIEESFKILYSSEYFDL